MEKAHRLLQSKLLHRGWKPLPSEAKISSITVSDGQIIRVYSYCITKLNSCHGKYFMITFFLTSHSTNIIICTATIPQHLSIPLATSWLLSAHVYYMESYCNDVQTWIYLTCTILWQHVGMTKLILNSELNGRIRQTIILGPTQAHSQSYDLELYRFLL